MNMQFAYVELVRHFNSAFNDPIFILYVACALVDIVLGNIKAWTNDDVNSSVGLKGTLKHFGVFSFVVILLPPLSYYLGTSAVSLGIVTYLVYQYLISIVENLGQLGFDVPDLFKKKLSQLSEGDEEDE